MSGVPCWIVSIRLRMNSGGTGFSTDDEVGTRVWHFDHGRVTDVKGAYEEYAASLA